MHFLRILPKHPYKSCLGLGFLNIFAADVPNNCNAIMTPLWIFPQQIFYKNLYKGTPKLRESGKLSGYIKLIMLFLCFYFHFFFYKYI